MDGGVVERADVAHNAFRIQHKKMRRHLCFKCKGDFARGIYCQGILDVPHVRFVKQFIFGFVVCRGDADDLHARFCPCAMAIEQYQIGAAAPRTFGGPTDIRRTKS